MRSSGSSYDTLTKFDIDRAMFALASAHSALRTMNEVVDDIERGGDSTLDEATGFDGDEAFAEHVLADVLCVGGFLVEGDLGPELEWRCSEGIRQFARPLDSIVGAQRSVVTFVGGEEVPAEDLPAFARLRERYPAEVAAEIEQQEAAEATTPA
jgi:hypothetical protein